MSLLLPRTLTLDATTGWVSMNPPTGADQRSFRCLALPAPIVFSDELKPVRSAEEPYVSQSAAEAAAGSTSTAATLRASPTRRFTAGHSTGSIGGRRRRMPRSRGSPRARQAAGAVRGSRAGARAPAASRRPRCTRRNRRAQRGHGSPARPEGMTPWRARRGSVRSTGPRPSRARASSRRRAPSGTGRSGGAGRTRARSRRRSLVRGGPRHGAACASPLDGELRALRRRRLVAGGVLRRADQEVLAATEPLALQLPVEGELVRADLPSPDDAAREREVALLALAVLLRERLALAVHLAPRAALQHAEGDGGRLGQLEADFRGLLELERSRLHQKLEQRR